MRTLILFLLLPSLCLSQVERSGRRVMGGVGVARVGAFSPRFTDGFGGTSLSSRWSSSGTWSVVGGVTTNSPTLGAELWDAPAAALTSGTYYWTAAGGNTIANVSNTLQIAYVNNAAGVRGYLENAADLSSDLTIGQRYVVSVDHRASAGDYRVGIYTGGAADVFTGLFSSTSFSRTSLLLCAQRATGSALRLYNFSSGDTAYLDNASAKRINMQSQFALFDAKTSNNFDVSLVLSSQTSGVGAEVGMAVSYVDTANNVFVCYSSAAGAVRMEKLSGGTYYRLDSLALLYAPNTTLRCRKVDSAYTVFMNNRVWLQKTVSDPALMSATLHGMRSFATSSVIDSFAFIPHRKIFVVGDSKSTTLPYWVKYLDSAAYITLGTPLAVGGWKATHVRDSISAHLPKVSGLPDFVLINIGVNDATAQTSRSEYTGALASVLDTLHAKWPGARVGLMRVWGRDKDEWSDSVDAYIPDVMPSRSWVFYGPDERVWLKGSDNGATMTTDGVHYSGASGGGGEYECARQWRLILDLKP